MDFSPTHLLTYPPTHNLGQILDSAHPSYAIRIPRTFRKAMRIPQRAAAIATLALAVGVTACSDDNDVNAPPFTRSFAAGGQNQEGPSSLDLIEADYTGGLLDKDNANK